MPNFERLTTPATPVITTEEAKLFIRQDLPDEDHVIDLMVAAAAREIEAYAQIALLEQTVRVSVDGPHSAGRIPLPVGPVASGVVATVDMVAPDGSETSLSSANWSLVSGTAPAIWLIDDVAALPSLLSQSSTVLRIEYQAGWGPDPQDVPADLLQAVQDQTAQLYEMRAGQPMARHQSSMSPHAVRIAQRYRRSTV